MALSVRPIKIIRPFLKHAEGSCLFQMGTGRLVEIQGTAEGAPFGTLELNRMLAAARRGVKQILIQQRRALKTLTPVLS
jgi:ribonuclease PH